MRREELFGNDDVIEPRIIKFLSIKIKVIDSGSVFRGFASRKLGFAHTRFIEVSM